MHKVKLLRMDNPTKHRFIYIFISYAAFNTNSHIQPNADVANWMKNNIEHSNIWFQVMSTEHSILNCIVCKHNRFWSRSVNEQLIQDGIGVVDSEQSVAGNALYDKHLVRLIKLENKASKKNVGIWQEESVWQRWRNNKWHWPWPFKKD